MARTVLRRVGVLSLAKVTCAWYGALGLVFGGIVALFSLFGAAIGAGAEESAAPLMGVLFGVGAVVFLPILYAVLGFLGGLIGGLIYNALAGFVGGVELELGELPEPGGGRGDTIMPSRA